MAVILEKLEGYYSTTSISFTLNQSSLVMHRGYIITIVLLVIALIFTFQNTSTTSLNFLMWSFSGSQAFLTVAIFFLGFLSGWLLGMSSVWKKNAEIKLLNKKLEAMPANSASSR